MKFFKWAYFNLKLFQLKAHSCVERAALLGSVMCKKLPIDKNYRLIGESLLTQLEIDKKNGLIPFFVSLNKIDLNFSLN